jgi:hypothetical protein
VQPDRVEVDLHQLELRHRDLRIHDGEQRRRLIGSMAEIDWPLFRHALRTPRASCSDH